MLTLSSLSSHFYPSSFNLLFLSPLSPLLSSPLYFLPQIDSNGSKKSLDKDKEKEDEGKEIRFKLQDTHDGFGPMTKDLKVCYNLLNFYCLYFNFTVYT
jgi:hypothetical protein